MMSVILNKLETSRLIIRQLNEDDVANIYALMGDFETASKAGFRPVASLSEAEGFFRESIRCRSAYGMALCERPGDIFAIITLTCRSRETGEGACIETIDLGYFMRADMRGNGYMPEAVEALKEYLFNSTEADKIVIYLNPGNSSSRRVVEKCGFSFDNLVTEAGRNGATGELESLEYYSLSRVDYLSATGEQRWLLPEVMDYRRSVIEGTCSEMIRKRGIALTKIREVSRPEHRSKAIKDFLSDNVFPGDMYKSKDWEDTVRKMRQLFSFGYSRDDAVWQVADRLRLDLLSGGSTFDIGCAENLFRWLKAEGADINYIKGSATPLVLLNRAAEDLEGKAVPSEILSALLVLTDTLKELGAEAV